MDRIYKAVVRIRRVINCSSDETKFEVLMAMRRANFKIDAGDVQVKKLGPWVSDVTFTSLMTGRLDSLVEHFVYKSSDLGLSVDGIYAGDSEDLYKGPIQLLYHYEEALKEALTMVKKIRKIEGRDAVRLKHVLQRGLIGPRL